MSEPSSLVVIGWSIVSVLCTSLGVLPLWLVSTRQQHNARTTGTPRHGKVDGTVDGSGTLDGGVVGGSNGAGRVVGVANSVAAACMGLAILQMAIEITLLPHEHGTATGKSTHENAPFVGLVAAVVGWFAVDWLNTWLHNMQRGLGGAGSDDTDALHDGADLVDVASTTDALRRAVSEWWDGRRGSGRRRTTAAATRAILLVAVMTAHSAAEGISLGVSFGGGQRLGTWMSSALSLHNVPEGLAVGLVLVPHDTPPLHAAAWAAFTSLPQALLAFPAFVFVQTFSVLLPLGLGLACGAMAWMVVDLGGEAAEELGDGLAWTLVMLVATIAGYFTT